MTSQPKEKSTDDGLASQATSVVVNLVKSVRGKTTGPLLFVARLVVYSIAILIAASAAIVLFVIAAVKIVNQLLPGDVWAAYLLLGAVFALVGTFFWSKRVV
ncbi:MAG: hypothetical protein CL456_06520 [Acidimicrobiaceae bacterium]|nr:hypothetical protein [Acidimicrobiaceae bacterium]